MINILYCQFDFVYFMVIIRTFYFFLKSGSHVESSLCVCVKMKTVYAKIGCIEHYLVNVFTIKDGKHVFYL